MLVEIEDSPAITTVPPPITRVHPTWKPTWKPTWTHSPDGRPDTVNEAKNRGYEPRQHPTWYPTWKPHPLDMTPIPPIRNPNWKPTWKPTWKPKPYAKVQIFII